MKRDKGYLALREQAMERDEYKCCVCGKGPKYLNLSHILPEEIKEYKYDIDNVLMLCPKHHKLGNYSFHKNAIWFSRWLRIHRNKTYALAINRLKELLGEE